MIRKAVLWAFRQKAGRVHEAAFRVSQTPKSLCIGKEITGERMDRRSYCIQEVAGKEEFLQGLDAWPKAEIGCYPWGGAYRPEAYGICCAGSEALYVFLAAREEQLRCQVKEANGPVCTDSCLEFFYQPGDTGYFNFEWNPLGVLHLGFGKGRNGRVHPILEDGERFLLKLGQWEEWRRTGWWYVAFQVPFSFIRRYVPTFTGEGADMGRGNFYKCGDKTEQPHWGCYAPVKTEQPDYHRPEFFASFNKIQ